MRMLRHLATPLAAVAIALLAGSAHKAEAAKLEGRNVKIGCMVPLTGKGAEWGQAAKISMELAERKSMPKAASAECRSI